MCGPRARRLLGFQWVGLGPLADYGDTIKAHSDRYGPGVWPPSYQCDLRCRQEHTERLRRKLELAEPQARATGKATLMTSPDRLWVGVWVAAVADSDFRRREFEEPTPGFWREELVEPARLVLSKAGRLGDMLDIDISIARQPCASGGADAMVRRGEAPEAPGRGQAKRNRAHSFTHTTGAEQSQCVALVKDHFAAFSVPTDALLGARMRLHRAWFSAEVDIAPLNPDKISAARGYRSAANCAPQAKNVRLPFFRRDSPCPEARSLDREAQHRPGEAVGSTAPRRGLAPRTGRATARRGTCAAWA